MGIELVLGLVIVAALAGLAYAAFNFFSVKKLPEGNERMQEIAGEIRLGAITFINYEYRVVAVVAAIIILSIFSYAIFKIWQILMATRLAKARICLKENPTNVQCCPSVE